MSNRDSWQIEDAPPVWGPTTRISVLLEPEAARMLDELCHYLSHDRRIGARRAEVIEQGIRMMYRRTFGNNTLG